MPILPKLVTCLVIVFQTEFTVHNSCNKHGRDKTIKFTMEVWCMEQNIASIADLTGCN